MYVGGSEHAVAHLLYSRLWVKVLYDLGYLSFDEPFKKLINQGKITAESKFVYRVRNTNQFVSAGLKDQYEADPLHVDINIIDGSELDIEALKNGLRFCRCQLHIGRWEIYLWNGHREDE